MDYAAEDSMTSALIFSTLLGVYRKAFLKFEKCHRSTFAYLLREARIAADDVKALLRLRFLLVRPEPQKLLRLLILTEIRRCRVSV